MRFGLLEYTQLGFPDDCNGNDGAPDYANTYGYNLGLTIPAPQCGFASVTVTGFNALGAQSTNGGPQANHFSVWSGIDSLSYTRGSHLFKFGGEIHDTLFSGSKSLTNDNGVFSFGKTSAFTIGGTNATALEDFLSGVAANSGNKILVGNATLSEPLQYNRYALFAQDDWRIRPRVTLNIGVRWEYVQPPTTPNNVLGNFNVGSPTGLIQEVDGKGVYTLPKDLFSPRLGIAWDVTGKGTTVVRLGGTYMHDFLVFQQLLPNLQNVPTGFALVLPNGALASPQPGNNLLGTLAPSTLNWTGTGSVITLTHQYC